jgi:dolichol-phosphate mannosyltransferase
MPRYNNYSIILPTYNEKDNIVPIIRKVHQVMTDANLNFEIIVVDDNSPDETFNEAAKESVLYTNVKVLWRKEKSGLGSAYAFAMQSVRGNWVVIMDADHSHPPECIPEMIVRQQMTCADVVNGTRYAKHGGIVGWPLHRRLTSVIANWIAKLLLGLHKQTDVTGSFRLYRKTALVKVLPYIVSKGYSFQPEVLSRLVKMNFAVVEQPFVFTDRQNGLSKMNVWEIVGFVWCICIMCIMKLMS